jgi:hypothetical protein
MKTQLKWHQIIFLITLYISWILSTLSLFTFFKFYLQDLSFIINQILKIYIALILMYKFNPWFGKRNCTDFDKNLVWHGSFFLFISTLLTSTLMIIFNNVEKKLKVISKII